MDFQIFDKLDNFNEIFRSGHLGPFTQPPSPSFQSGFNLMFRDCPIVLNAIYGVQIFYFHFWDLELMLLIVSVLLFHIPLLLPNDFSMKWIRNTLYLFRYGGAI